MEKQLEVIHLVQQNFIKITDSLNEEQLNKIPDGFNNNIIWNFAHILSSLQMLCYVRAGLSARLEETFIHLHKNGTKPDGQLVSKERYEKIKGYATEALLKFKEDYTTGYFNEFVPYSTLTGFEINNIETAVEYVIMHHGLHFGYASALKKLV